MGVRSADTSFAIGFGVGIIVGISVAFVLSPRSGEETRDLIKDKTMDVRGRIREITGDRKKIYADGWKQPKVKPYAAEFD